MKVAVTGANGFLAGYLKRELDVAGVESLCLVRTQRYPQRAENCTLTDYSYASLVKILGGGKCYRSFGLSTESCSGYGLLW